MNVIIFYYLTVRHWENIKGGFVMSIIDYEKFEEEILLKDKRKEDFTD